MSVRRLGIGAFAAVVCVVVCCVLALPVLAAGEAPSVDNESPSSVTPFKAFLEAQVNPHEEATTSCTFEYGTTTAYGSSAPCEQGTLEGGEDQFASAGVTGLEPNTTYHFRIVVENATGKTEGIDSQFTTLTAEAPIVDSESTSVLTTTTATLEAQVNPNYQETTYSFEYATEEGAIGTPQALTVNGGAALSAGFEDQLASVEVASLTQGTTYFYRVLATNASGTTEGAVQSFITVGPPLITPGSVVNVTRTSAQLTGAKIDPVGATVTYTYRYIDQAGYEAGLSESPSNPYAKGARSLPAREIAGEFEGKPVFTSEPTATVTLSELKPATTYHLALVATNSAGTTFGADASFTTLPATPPLASTGGAEGVSQLSASITGTVDTRGLPTISQFEFGTAPGAGSLLPASVAPGSGVLAVSLSFSGDLQPGTTYYYRTVATNADGTSYGEVRSFTTATFPGQAGPPAVSLVAWPGFVLKELAAGPPKEPVAAGPKRLTKAQKLKKALKACAKKPKRKRAACRRAAKKRYR